MIRLSANLGFMWPDRPLPERIDAAGKAGFRAVEMHWPYEIAPEDLARMCRQAGVSVVGLNTPVGNPGEFGLGALPGREREFEAAFELALRYCAVTGAGAVHAMAGVVDDTPESAATLVANLRRAAQAAARSGVTVLLEPINRRDKPGYFYSGVERAAEIATATGAENVKLMFDVYHVGVAQGDVLRRFETHLPMVGHIQVAAVPSRAEPDEGEIDYRTIFKAIDASGYAGWVGCEYRPRGDTDAGLGWIDTVLHKNPPGSS